MTTLPAGALCGMTSAEDEEELAEALAAGLTRGPVMMAGTGMRCDVTVTPGMDSFHDMRPLPVRPLPPIPQRFGLPCVRLSHSYCILTFFAEIRALGSARDHTRGPGSPCLRRTRASRARCLRDRGPRRLPSDGRSATLQSSSCPTTCTTPTLTLTAGTASCSSLVRWYRAQPPSRLPSIQTTTITSVCLGVCFMSRTRTRTSQARHPPRPHSLHLPNQNQAHRPTSLS